MKTTPEPLTAAAPVADDVPPLSVMTKEATDISPTAAKTGGNIAGRSTGITERGVCWATSNDPTINNNKAADATGAGAESFTINISGLTPSTTYYVRAYAIKNSETIYGEVISFTTRNAVPVITTAAVDYATVRSARSGGNITYSGVLPIIMRGVCWSRTPNPTINNKKTADGAGAGSFTSDINPLVSDSLYYARAYATTGEGTYYGNEISFKTTSYAVDQDGEYYETVLIGEQVWFAENLRTAKYNEGTGIPHITTGWDVANGDGFCWYNNYPANKYAYGALYKGHAVVTGKLCPTGWHVPSNADWQQLKDFLGYPEGTKLKATSGWNTPVDGDGNGTNESGFNGLAGGFRYESGTFGGLGEFGRWWSSTEFTGNSAHLLSMSLNYERLDMTTHHNDKRQGLSVRCVKD